jgi:nucleoside-diphosphate-sugar epimerase
VRVLVTGAAGFIGSHLCDRLVMEGHRVVGLDDLSAGAVSNLAASPSVDLVEGDLRDRAVVHAAARGCDVIFHQGAVRSVSRSVEDPGKTTEVNVSGTLNVLLAAQPERARVIFASSSSVYGDQRHLPLHEELIPQPRSPYAASKLAGEVYCSSWTRTFGIHTVSLRYFNVYGPRQDPHSEYATVVPLFILACLEGARPTIHGDGEQARDFTYIDDVIEANIRAARAPASASGRVINIGGGAGPTTVNRLLHLIADITGAHPDPEHVGPRTGDVRITDADVTLAANVLGFRPSTSLEQGMRRSVSWFRESALRSHRYAGAGSAPPGKG